VPASIDDWRLTIDDLLTIRRLGHCGIRLTIAAFAALTLEAITTVELKSQSWLMTELGSISIRHSFNRQSGNAAIAN
jgi:hypothetical protein